MEDFNKDRNTVPSLFSDSFFHQLVDVIDESISVSILKEDNSISNFVFVNDNFCQRLGYSREELLQCSVYDIHHQSDIENISKSVLKALSEGACKAETIQIDKAGISISVELHIKVLKEGNTQFFVCISRDIAEQIQLEKELEEKSEKYRALSDSYNDAVFISEKGKCIEQNLAAENMFGYTIHEAIGRTGTDWIAPENRELVMNNMLNGYEDPYEVTALRKDGTTFPCLLHGTMMNFRGRTVRTTTLRDITHQKEIQKIEKESEDNFRRIISDMQVGVLLFATDFSITFCNPVALAYLGLKLTDIIGKSALDPMWEFVNEDYSRIPNENGPIAIAFRTQKPVKEVVIGMKKPLQNKIAWLLVDSIPQFDLEGKFYRIVCTFRDISGRIEAERELFKNETLFREITDHSPSGVVLLNPDRTYKFVSKHFEGSTGFSATEVLGLDPIQHIHPDDVKSLVDKLSKFIESSGSIFTSQYRFLRKDGSYVWVESTFSNLLNIKGIETILINYKVINEQKLAEEKISNLEKQYLALFENMLDGFTYCQMQYDENGKAVDWTYLAINKAFGVLTGLDNVIGKKVSDVLPGIQQTDPRLFEIYGRVSLTGAMETFEMFVNALQLWFYVTVYSFEKGYFIAIFDDITEIKMTENIIKESNKKLIQAEKIAKIGYWELDVVNKTVYGSESANKIYGNHSTPITLEKLRSYRLPEYSQMVDERMQQLVEENVPYEVDFKIKNETSGEIIDIHSIADYNPETKIIFGVIQDVTEINKIKNQLEKQNQELKKTNSELDKFVYSTSHDLRAPLKSVLGLINLIEMEDNAMLIKEQMQMMKTSVVKLDDFIEDIMHYYRNTQLIVNPELLNLEEIIEKIQFNLANINGFEKIKFIRNIEPSVTLLSDKQRVTIILNNIISNAIKYKDLKKTEQFVKIDVFNSIVSTNIIIEDNGIGIAEQDTQKIFGMFFRATKHSTGSGLGLYIVKETLEKIGGTIHVESVIGKGTKFIIKIPTSHEQ